MKLDRLIGILMVLQKEGGATAPELAFRFEVSRRTIHRDIEDLCKAGIPIVTTQGTGGGIRLMEDYALDAAMFSREELSAFLAGLKSLDSVAQSPDTQRLAIRMGSTADESISIDLSSFYRDDLADKISRIRNAIRENRCIIFTYYYDKGEDEKLIEPYQVVYQWSDWYVFGFCPKRQEFRLYKLRRLWNLSVGEERFAPRKVPETSKKLGSHMTDDYMVTAIFEPEAKYRLVEEYGPNCFSVEADGRLLLRRGFNTQEAAVRWFIGFASQVCVLDPPEMVDWMRREINKMAAKYTEPDI